MSLCWTPPSFSKKQQSSSCSCYEGEDARVEREPKPTLLPASFNFFLVFNSWRREGPDAALTWVRVCMTPLFLALDSPKLWRLKAQILKCEAP